MTNKRIFTGGEQDAMLAQLRREPIREGETFESVRLRLRQAVNKYKGRLLDDKQGMPSEEQTANIIRAVGQLVPGEQKQAAK